MQLTEGLIAYLQARFGKDERGQSGLVESLIYLVIALFVIFVIYKLVVMIAADT